MNKRHYEHTLPNIRGSLSNTYISERGSEPDIISFTGYRHMPQIFKKTDKGNLSNLFQFHNPLIYHKTDADSILGMAMSETSAPQETFTQGSRQCHTVGKV